MQPNSSKKADEIKKYKNSKMRYRTKDRDIEKCGFGNEPTPSSVPGYKTDYPGILHVLINER